MGNWKSEENINQFKQNSFEALAQDFLERGYDFYVDGFTPQPTFQIPILENDKDINWIRLHCQINQFENYKEMISILEKLGKDNYIFMYAIMPFQMRIATLSSEYDVPYTTRKNRIREQKINELLND